MDRCHSRVSLGWLLLALTAVLVPQAGCNVMANALWVFNGSSVPALCNDLKGKRVAVVCRPASSLQFGNDSAARELAKQVGLLLQKNVQRITLIDQREIAEWTDENSWEEFLEVGKALKADMVVGLELEDFNLYKDQTLYQGKANLTMLVYDVHKGKEPVYEPSLPQMLYPPNTPIAANEMPVAQFRRKFLTALAEQVARHFYDHDATADFANDSTAIY